jgi:hypothetical protein
VSGRSIVTFVSSIGLENLHLVLFRMVELALVSAFTSSKLIFLHRLRLQLLHPLPDIFQKKSIFYRPLLPLLVFLVS